MLSGVLVELGEVVLKLTSTKPELQQFNSPRNALGFKVIDDKKYKPSKK